MRAGSTAKAAATPPAPAKAMPGRRAGVLPMPPAEVALRIRILDADTANGTRIRDLLLASMSARKDENAEGMLESCGVGRD